jgi:hypothetical protein
MILVCGTVLAFGAVLLLILKSKHWRLGQFGDAARERALRADRKPDDQ